MSDRGMLALMAAAILAGEQAVPVSARVDRDFKPALWTSVASAGQSARARMGNGIRPATPA